MSSSKLNKITLFMMITMIFFSCLKSSRYCKPFNTTEVVSTEDDDGLISYNDCGKGNLLRLKVVGCEPTEEKRSRFCLLTRGGNASLVAKFMPDANYAWATTDVRIKIGFLDFGYPPIEHDACLHYVTCPIVAKQLTAARVTFPIPSLVPRFGNMLITARLYGPNGQLIVCGQSRAGLI